MLGKIFKKKEDEFFMAIPEGVEAVETPVAPAIAEAPAKSEAPQAIAPAPAVTASSTDNSAIIAAALSQYAAAATTPTETETFADQYLVNAGNTANRRRPGANMAAFVGMAKNVRV